MTDTLHMTSTAAKLRLLAKALESDEVESIPDFSVCIVEESPEGETLFLTTQRAENNVFGLIGLLQYQVQKLSYQVLEQEQ